MTGAHRRTEQKRKNKAKKRTQETSKQQGHNYIKFDSDKC
jgi:hypothetical protein